MKRITNVDAYITCKKFSTALDRFFKKFEGHEEWRETFEWMHEEGIEFFCDDLLADGTKNQDWCYALHLETFDNGYYYMALIERA